ncbi:hypothetical protein [Actinophytocola oryzae]|uniref:Uncharacterized protein n=1 Tax=Actinophytocola oryzae TaxID=502181 RepID=A0A4R7W625_9PSEU|nr:hypothetical protein [Actinophytocola oryzae]TDV57459.1 hypothetical protein CLV71_101330 [Actinophytocola oryzae]
MTEPDPPVDEAVDDWDDDEPDDEQTGQSGGIGVVRGDRNISVTDPRAAVSIFDRVRVYLQANAEPGTGRPPRLVPEDILTDLVERFVPPPGYGDLVARLRAPGTVVVSGSPGCGRRSAALMVLKESGDGATRFRELPDDGADGGLVLDAEVVEPGERLLLDLSGHAEPITRHFLANLRAYRASVAERQAYLAVVLSTELRYVAAELGTEAVLVGRPDGRKVFLRHLEALGVPVRERLDETLVRHLDHDPMGHIAALAGRVRRAWSVASGQGDWTTWLVSALDPDAELDAVARFVRENPDGRVRALLLAAAVFEHTTPEVVESMAAAFLDVVGYPPHEGHRLDLPDLREALARVEATIDAGRVRFTSVAYADAVRTHFWRTFPDLRQSLRRWFDRGVRSRALSPADRTDALLGYTTQCLRTGHPGDLCGLVEQWARRSPSTVDYLLDAAGAALTQGLLSESHGSWFRRRFYDWSTDHRLSPSLAILVAGLCEGVIAPARPHQALVRLRHLTRHTRPEVVAEARAVLGKLCRDGRFARRMLTRVHEDLTGEHPRAVDYELFTDVADPVRLTAGATSTSPGMGSFPRLAEQSVRALLVDGWAAYLAAALPYETVVAAVTRWLDASVTETVLLDVLAAATRGRARPRALLYAVSRDWVAAATAEARHDRTRTAALLRQACADIRQETQSPVAQGATF